MTVDLSYSPPVLPLNFKKSIGQIRIDVSLGSLQGEPTNEVCVHKEIVPAFPMVFYFYFLFLVFFLFGLVGRYNVNYMPSPNSQMISLISLKD